MITNFMIDPPWPVKKIVRRVRPRQLSHLDYQVLSVEDIFTLLDKEVLVQAAPIHNVWMWATERFLRGAESCMAEREYHLHARLIWNKTNGLTTALTIRFTHEYLLWFYKPKLLPVAQHMRGKIPSVFEEKSREHSRKPNSAYRIVELLYDTGDKMDVFSREKRKGWKQFGNQTNHFLSYGFCQ